MLFWGMIVLFGVYGCVILGYGCVILGGVAVLFWGMVVLFGGYNIISYSCPEVSSIINYIHNYDCIVNYNKTPTDLQF